MPSTRIVYLDRNILGDIRQRMICSTEAYDTIRNSIRDGMISIPVSLTVLEETLPVIKVSSSFKKEGELQIVRELLNWNVGIRPHVDLLYGDVKAYAHGSPLLPRWMSLNFTPDEILSASPEKMTELIAVVGETAEQLADNLKATQMARQEFKDKLADKGGKIKFAKDVTFSNIWKRLALGFATKLADHLGIRRECEARGMEGLLELRTVRLYVGYSLSYEYGKLVVGEKLTQGDSRDHHHAVLASVAEVFVTHDAALSRLLKRIPINSFCVMTLNEFLHWLKCLEWFNDWGHLSSDLHHRE